MSLDYKILVSCYETALSQVDVEGKSILAAGVLMGVDLTPERVWRTAIKMARERSRALYKERTGQEL